MIFFGAWVLTRCWLAYAIPTQAAQPEASPSKSPASWVRASETRVPNGGVLLLTARVPSAGEFEVVGRFQGDEFKFMPAGDGEGGHTERVALLGIPYFQKPGRIHVEVTAKPKSRKSAGADSQPAWTAAPLAEALEVDVYDAGYRAEKLSVDPRKLKPTRKDLARINAEKNEIGKLYRDRNVIAGFDARFVLPIESPVTSPYGTKRLFNGQMQSFHQGLDLKARDGTPIVAAADGVIVLAKDLYFTGNTVLVDHGYGVFTVYAHMSRIEARLGSAVRAGQRIGLSGSTGRVSGPHLHWGAVIRGVKVDPGLLPFKGSERQHASATPADPHQATDGPEQGRP